MGHVKIAGALNTWSLINTVISCIPEVLAGYILLSAWVLTPSFGAAGPVVPYGNSWAGPVILLCGA